MRYKQPIERKLDQLENMLTGFGSRFSDPKFNIMEAKEMLSAMKDKVEEIRSLINAKSFEDVIEFGKQLGKLLIVTRGEKGSIAIKNQEIVECQSKPNLKIVDLTGAGDLFAAGFLHGLINNISTKECLEKGTEMSSKIIQKVGARLD